ncbi:MAG: SDR family NAD(P)-dependent oxidoreductase [Pseudomonadota bacterium]
MSKPQSQKKIVIVGATSAMAEHCARLWVATGSVNELVLVGRDAARLNGLAADLRVRAPACTVELVEVSDFNATAPIEAGVADACRTRCPDIVLVAHGSLPDQTRCQDNLNLAREALELNGLSPVLFAEAFMQRLVPAGRGTLVLIGSVAGDRGRRSNYVYGAAKGLVTRYAQGLQHRLAASGTQVKVVLIKPGPTATPMTAHLPASKLASVEEVAALIVRGAERGTPVVYAPGKWALIMNVIRHLPALVFNRMDI